METFAARLTALRKGRDLTTNRLATLAGLTPPYLYRIQEPDSTGEVSLSVAARLARQLDPEDPALALARLAGLAPLPEAEKKSRKKSV